MASWFNKAYWNAFTLWNMRGEKRLPYRPLEEILSIQSRRVRAIVKHAYETVPYYREVMDEAGLAPGDFRTADDLARLPILTGDQLAAAPERFLSRRYADGRSILLHTSGTTGQTKNIYYDPAAIFLALAQGHRRRVVLARFVGRACGYRQISSLMPDGANLQLLDFYRDCSWIPRKVDLQRINLSMEASIEENIERINNFKPEVILSQGSYAGAIFRRAWESGIPIHRPKAVLYGGDSIADRNLRLIETEFGVPALASYQAVEAPNIAFQCERREGYHISLDLAAVRVVDRNGNTLGPGDTGDILISNLTNRATILLNYKLGDVVTLGSAPCPCGRTLPTIELNECRTGDLVVLTGGRMILSDIVMKGPRAVPGVVQLQLIQEDLRRFVVNVFCDAGADWDKVRQDLDTALRSRLGHDISVSIKRMDSVPTEPGGKFRPFIQRYAG